MSARTSKAPKDVNAPKKPLSTYFMFTRVRRAALKAAQPNLKVTDMAKVMSAEWKALDASAKDKYNVESAKAKSEYATKLAEYKKTSEFAEYTLKLAQWEKERDEQEDNSDSDSDFQPTEKKRKKRAAPKSKKVKATAKQPKQKGLTKKAVNEFRKQSNGYVKTLDRFVKANWHDGWYEQGEKLGEYFDALMKPAQCVYEHIIKHRDFDKLNEILKNMADSWANIHAIPFRCNIADSLGDADRTLILTETAEKISFITPDQLISFLWSLMLCALSADDDGVRDDVQIFRYIKDAVDNGVDVLNGHKEEQLKKHTFLKEGEARLKTLFEDRAKWSNLKSTKKVHKMRRIYDCRYD